MWPRARAARDDLGDVIHVGQLDDADAVEDSAPGNPGQRGGPCIPEDVGRIGGAHAAQGQADVHVGAHLRTHGPRRALGCGNEVETQAAPLRGEPQQDLHRGWVSLGEETELVDGNDESGGGLGDRGGVALVGALPRGQVGEPACTQLLLAAL